MPFFIRNKHKSPNRSGKTFSKSKKTTNGLPPKSKKKIVDDEEISSDSDVEPTKKRKTEESDESEEETAQQKRLRLTKKYLQELETQEIAQAGSDEDIGDAISSRLHADIQDTAGRLRREVAKDYKGREFSETYSLRCKQQHGIVTCLTLSSDHIYTASKDAVIVKWSIKDKTKVGVIKRKEKDKTATGHATSIQALAISSDNKYLVSGCVSGLIQVWDPSTLSHVKYLQGHRGGITGLCIRRGDHSLYSASADRSVKVWSLDEMAYVETLFGHQDVITSIDCLYRERCVTSGGLDGAIRVWKIVEESQLIFRGHTEFIDAVKLLNEENFISCSNDGSLAVWHVSKRRPLSTVHAAHGLQDSGLPNWISAITTLVNTDLVATGSCDGVIRLWKCTGNRHLNEISKIPVSGFINSLELSSDGRLLIAAVGREHRLGRWWCHREVKNRIVVIQLINDDT